MTMRQLSVAPLTLNGLKPAQYIRVAAQAGFRYATVRTIAGSPLSQPEQMASLIRSSGEVREVKAVMAVEGVRAHEIEFACVDCGTNVPDFKRGLDWAADLGGRYLVTISNDADASRRLDNISSLAEMAQPFGIRLIFEFIPWLPVNTLAAAAELAEGVGRGMGVLIDTLHLDRSGGSASDIAAFDPALFPYMQLCDAPAERPNLEEMQRQSTDERIDPGKGGLDLTGVLIALPPGIPINLEVPSRTRVAMRGYLAHAVSVREQAERLIAVADTGRSSE